MKTILHILKQILFVICILLLGQIIFMSSVTSEGINGQNEIELSSSMSDSKYTNSLAFNQMFGNSLSDIISYAAIMQNNEEPSYHGSISANTIDINNNHDTNKYSAKYDYGNTNINYFLCTVNDDKSIVFNNINAKTANIVDLKNKIYDLSDIYIFYDSKTNVFNTNTEIKKETVLELLNHYSDTFGDNVVVMAGLNKNLKNIQDTYYIASQKYNLYTSHYWFKIVVIIITGFLVLLFAVILTLKTGNVYDKDLNKKVVRLYSFDKIAIEIKLLLLLIISVPYIILADNSNVIFDSLINLYVKDLPLCIFVCAVFVLITGIIISIFYYSFVRRLKTHSIYETSLLKKLIIRIKKCITNASKNIGALISTCIKVLAISITNILLTYFAVHYDKYYILILLAIIDILIGRLIYVNAIEQKKILSAITDISGGKLNTKIDSDKLYGNNKFMAEAVNNVGEAVKIAVDTSMKDEKLKADLITNVSHDLKTPLTSIINYVDLLKKEDIQDEKVLSYINILDEKSQRLKQLTDDLVEASKISSGNIVLTFEKINLKELFIQATGEFLDRFDEKNLKVSGTAPDEAVFVNVDSRSIYRVIENLYTNIYKYSMPGTRVFIDISKNDAKAFVTIKNISDQPLNIDPKELTERFIRGDESRNTEGSGLGLSIAKNLTEAMNGTFDISIDGDLFKIILTFDLMV